VTKDWRPKDVPNKQELERKQKLINQNQQTYDVWRLNYEKGILCAARAFANGDGHIAVVPVSQGKKESLHNKT
jgi:hypothetical protein